MNGKTAANEAHLASLLAMGSQASVVGGEPLLGIPPPLGRTAALGVLVELGEERVFFATPDRESAEQLLDAASALLLSLLS